MVEISAVPTGRVAQRLPWIIVGVALIFVLAAEAFLALFSIAPLFGDYATRTESFAVALVMVSMGVLAAALAVVAWGWGRRWLILIFVLPGVVALLQAGRLALNTRPDDEMTRPPWDIVIMLSGLNLVLTAVVIIVGVQLATRRPRSARGSE